MVRRTWLLVFAFLAVHSGPVLADYDFSTNVRVDDAPDGTSQIWPKIASPDPDEGSDHLYAVWMDNRLGPYHVYFSRSTDGGDTWLTPNVKVDSAGEGWFPDIAVGPSGNLTVVWRDADYNVYAATSWNQGDAWSNRVKVNIGNTGSSDYWGQSVTFGPSGNVYATWSDNRTGAFTDVYFSRSIDGGTSWLASDIRVNDDSGDRPVAARPTIRVYGNDLADEKLYVSFIDWEGPGAGRYPDAAVTWSTDHGNTWSSPDVIANDITLYYQQPGDNALAIDDDGSVLVAWYHDTFSGATSVRSATSFDGGSTFMPSVYINDSSEASCGPTPAVAANGDRLFAVWQYQKNGEHDIFFAYSDDAGLSWSDPNDQVDDGGPGVLYQYNPIVAAGPSGAAYVVWMDGRLSGGLNYDIFFARGDVPAGIAGDTVRLPTLLRPVVWPNPAQGPVCVSYRPPAGGPVTVGIFDALGRQVATPQGDLIPGGEVRFLWNGRDDHGRLVPSGRYLIRIEDGDGIAATPVTIAR